MGGATITPSGPCLLRHGRACPGHPRLASARRLPWMPGSSPGMTKKYGGSSVATGPLRACAGKIQLERGAVDRGEGGEVGDGDGFVHLVRGEVQEPELGAGAGAVDEARVGGAAGGAE